MSALFSGFAGLGITFPVRPPIQPAGSVDGARRDLGQSQPDRQTTTPHAVPPGAPASPQQLNEKRN